ncbi:hypothetical protein [Streptomyces sp. NPDC126514]|uniref:hypothetical protein n=1 Tax=Streptomyces sp. NPDC126514 TaxID=3155210 RepID=UPI003318CBA5
MGFVMPMPAYRRRLVCSVVAAVGAGGLLGLAAAPASFAADEAAADLVVGGVAPVGGVTPGSVFDVPVTVGNKGPGVAGKVWVSYAVTRGLDFAEIPSNCWTQQVRAYDEMPERWTAACSFEQEVEPGAVYTLERPMRVKALQRAFHDELRVRVAEDEPGVDDNGTVPVVGTAPAVKLVESQAGGGGSAHVVDVPVTSVNTADFQVTGAALQGSVGETVPMKVEFTNAGPAWVMVGVGKPSVSVMITPPAGTSVVKKPGFCKLRSGVYDCGMSQPALHEGGRQTYTFTLKIDKRVADAKGSVALNAEVRPLDPDPANDKADITLDVTGASPTTSPTTSPTASPTAGPTAGPTADPSGGSTGGSGSGSGGSSTGGNDAATATGGRLAETGWSSALPVTGVAAAAAVTGAGTLVVMRRRTRSLR